MGETVCSGVLSADPEGVGVLVEIADFVDDIVAVALGVLDDVAETDCDVDAVGDRVGVGEGVMGGVMVWLGVPELVAKGVPVEEGVIDGDGGVLGSLRKLLNPPLSSNPMVLHIGVPSCSTIAMAESRQISLLVR